MCPKRTPIATTALLIIITGCAVDEHRRTYDQQRQAYLLKRLDIAAENIANKDTTFDENGLYNPYRRKVVQWHAASRSWSVVEDASPFRERHEPWHSLAGVDGFVRYPNVDLNDECTELAAAAAELERLRAERPGK